MIVEHSRNPGQRTSCSSPASGRPAVDHAAAVGIALRHITELVRLYVKPHPSDAFVVTAVATKQIGPALLADRPTDRIAEIVLDANRIALPDGTTARSLLGSDWNEFERDSAALVASTVAFARAEGLASLLRLSAWHARADADAWWGTPSWDGWVDRLANAGHTSPALSAVLRSRPEIVDHLTLCRVLSRAHGERAPSRGLTPTAA